MKSRIYFVPAVGRWIYSHYYMSALTIGQAESQPQAMAHIKAAYEYAVSRWWR